MADFKLTADNSDVLAKLDQIQSKVSDAGDKFAKAFDKMNIAATALGATLLAAAHSTMEFADNVSDLADANQLAIGEVLALSAALEQSGGKADSAAKMLQTLSNKTEEAANGNLKTLASFEKLGVSLEDIGNKSTSEIKDKLLDNIAAIENPMQRNAKAVEMFGKAMIGVDVRKFAEEQKKGREEMEKYAAPLKSAGDAFDKLAQIAEKTKIAFAVVFQPFFDIINKLDPSVEGIATKFRIMGSALIAMSAPSILAGLNLIRIALLGMAAAAMANPYVALAKVLIGVGTFAASYFGIFSSGADDAKKETDKLNDSTKQTERDISGANEALKKQADAFAKIGRELQNNFDIALRKYDQETKNLSLSEDQKAIEEAIAKVGEDGLAAKIKLQEAFNALSDDDKARQRTVDAYKSELDLIDQRTTKQKAAVAEAIKGIQDQIAANKDLQTAATNVNSFLSNNLTNYTKLLGDVSGYNARIEVESKLNTIVALRGRLMEQVSKVSDNEKDTAIKAVGDITSEVELLGLSYKGVNNAVQDYMTSLLMSGKISQDTYEKLISQTKESRDAIVRVGEANEYLALRNSDRQRSFRDGWLKAYASYIEESTNAAKQVEQIFSKSMSGLEDYFVNRLKGISGGWKKFVASLAEDLVRASLKQSMGKLLEVFNLPGAPAKGQATTAMAGILGNKSLTERGISPANPVFVSDVFKSGSGVSDAIAGTTDATKQTSMWESIKTTISDFASSVSTFMGNMFNGLGSMISNMVSGLGSILSSIGGTLFDVIGSIGGTLFDIIGSLGSGLGDILGSLGGGGGGGILSTLFDWGASLFGFANGGIIPGNGPVVVGEKGPELLFGAGGMGVMNNQDSFGGATNITYNINAVDAMSFKQMIAQDPTFLYAVTMQGAKGMPLGR